MSFLEALTNVAAGYTVAVTTQIIVFPMFGMEVGFSDNLAIGVIFSGVSILRSFALRRVFEAIRVRRVWTG